LKPVETSTVRLRALSGTPLAQERVRSTVEAAARALAERNAVEVSQLSCEADAITLTLGINKLAALGFLAELRRVTEAWHRAKFNAGLWGELPPANDHDQNELDLGEWM
jgi:poly-gamma-glutamate capsule biosynthesis protein CapA/YwtB (metallophosphatase superfamily)